MLKDMTGKKDIAGVGRFSSLQFARTSTLGLWQELEDGCAKGSTGPQPLHPCMHEKIQRSSPVHPQAHLSEYGVTASLHTLPLRFGQACRRCGHMVPAAAHEHRYTELMKGVLSLPTQFNLLFILDTRWVTIFCDIGLATQDRVGWTNYKLSAILFFFAASLWSSKYTIGTLDPSPAD
eukprot:scaffold85640_cov19-Tisochrysis_lutea.AAC.1